MVVDVEDLVMFLSNGQPCDTNCIELRSRIGVQDEQIVFTATAGDEYFIIVRGFEKSTGTYNLTLACADPCDEDITLVSPTDDIQGAASSLEQINPRLRSIKLLEQVQWTTVQGMYHQKPITSLQNLRSG